MTESTVDPGTPLGDPKEAGPDTILVWVCPDCGAWAGSSNMPDLATQQNRRTAMQNSADEDPSQWGRPIGTRAVCQSCLQQRGVKVNRRPVEFVRKDRLDQALADAVEAAYRQEEVAGGVKLPRRT